MGVNLSSLASEDNDTSRMTSIRRRKGVLDRFAIVALFLLIVLVGGCVVVVNRNPELSKRLSQEHKIARVVIDRMRKEFVMKERSQVSEGK